MEKVIEEEKKQLDKIIEKLDYKLNNYEIQIQSEKIDKLLVDYIKNYKLD
jgi:hypothetical protein